MYEKNIDMRISPASLTKLMTALILFENYALAEELTVSLPSNYIYEGKVAYLKNGDKLSTEQLLRSEEHTSELQSPDPSRMPSSA